jgi:hypothetical protein
MSRDLNPSTIESINSSFVKPFFAVELLFDGNKVIRLWTGEGTLTLEDNTQWVGSGNFLDISSVEETSEMSVRGATLTLSAVPNEVLSLALSEPYQGRVCNIYFGTFSLGSYSGSIVDESGSYILLQDGSKIDLQNSGGNASAFNEIFSGYMDQMNVEEGPTTSVVELKVENKLIDLERARVARFTSGYQKSKYPLDKGLDFVEGLQNKKVLWGRS